MRRQPSCGSGRPASPQRPRGVEPGRRRGGWPAWVRGTREPARALRGDGTRGAAARGDAARRAADASARGAAARPAGGRGRWRAAPPATADVRVREPAAGAPVHRTARGAAERVARRVAPAARRRRSAGEAVAAPSSPAGGGHRVAADGDAVRETSRSRPLLGMVAPARPSSLANSLSTCLSGKAATLVTTCAGRPHGREASRSPLGHAPAAFHTASHDRRWAPGHRLQGRSRPLPTRHAATLRAPP